MPEAQALNSARSPDAETVLPPSLLRTIRVVEADVNSLFIERWSPRAFSEEPIPAETLRTLFEAARWAPSCANEQPSLFVYATSADDRARFALGLSPSNRVWAERAPVLAFLFARNRFAQAGPYQGHSNPSSTFDAGAAWMSLALQAHMVGLSTHAMGGIEHAEVYRLTGVSPTEYTAVVAIAIGRRADPSALPEPLAARERPSPRRPLNEVAVEGHFPPPAPA
jgi:nitroreductase